MRDVSVSNNPLQLRLQDSCRSKDTIYYKYTEDIYMLSTATAVGIRLIVSMQRWLLGDGGLAPGLDNRHIDRGWN